jgi:cold shock CspA family protein
MTPPRRLPDPTVRSLRAVPSAATAFPEAPPPRMNGTIVRLLKDKGFGFIQGSDGNEYFFHVSVCLGGAHGLTWQEADQGVAVVFEPGKTVKGLRAIDVELE